MCIQNAQVVQRNPIRACQRNPLDIDVKASEKSCHKMQMHSGIHMKSKSKTTDTDRYRDTDYKQSIIFIYCNIGLLNTALIQECDV